MSTSDSGGESQADGWRTIWYERASAGGKALRRGEEREGGSKRRERESEKEQARESCG